MNQLDMVGISFNYISREVVIFVIYISALERKKTETAKLIFSTGFESEGDAVHVPVAAVLLVLRVLHHSDLLRSKLGKYCCKKSHRLSGL